MDYLVMEAVAIKAMDEEQKAHQDAERKAWMKDRKHLEAFA